MKYITLFSLLLFPVSALAMSDTKPVDRKAYHCARDEHSTVRFRIGDVLFSMPYKERPILIDEADDSIRYGCYESSGVVHDVMAIQDGMKGELLFGDEAVTHPIMKGAGMFTLRFGFRKRNDYESRGIHLPITSEDTIVFEHENGIIVSLKFFNEQPAIARLGKEASVEKAKAFFESLIITE